MYAGFVSRAAALVVDLLLTNLIALVVTAAIGLVIAALTPHDFDVDTAGIVGTTAGWLLFNGAYFVAFWSLAGQTPGMRLLGLEVSTTEGRRIGIGRSLRRVLGMVLAALPLGAGFLLVLVDDRRQGLQDKLAGTVVRYA
jgi:uncharacterized RDD family membrane protein YckC